LGGAEFLDQRLDVAVQGHDDGEHRRVRSGSLVVGALERLENGVALAEGSAKRLKIWANEWSACHAAAGSELTTAKTDSSSAPSAGLEIGVSNPDSTARQTVARLP
jgi:hypothetical protein